MVHRRIRMLSISMLLLTFSLSGCAAMRQTEEVIQYAYETKQKAVALEAKVMEKVEALKGDLATVQKKLDTVETENLAYQKKVEHITGAWDKDGNGEVEPGDLISVVKDTVKGAIKDPEKRSLLFDWEFWAAIVGAAVLWVSRHLGIRTGRKQAEAAVPIQEETESST